jgi:hypothetical protein
MILAPSAVDNSSLYVEVGTCIEKKNEGIESNIPRGSEEDGASCMRALSGLSATSHTQTLPSYYKTNRGSTRFFLHLLHELLIIAAASCPALSVFGVGVLLLLLLLTHT